MMQFFPGWKSKKQSMSSMMATSSQGKESALQSAKAVARDIS